MATITIKNVPSEIHKELKLKAAIHHRSLNNEIINCLEQAIGWRQASPDETLMDARKMREKLSISIVDDDLNRLKAEGRS